jgi:S1-C subfamily serine protease
VVGLIAMAGFVMLRSQYTCRTSATVGRHGGAWASALRERPEGSGFLGVTLRAPCAVSYVAAGSPAEEAGLGWGDRIDGIDGRAVTHWRAFLNELWKHEPGDRVTLRVSTGSGVRLTEVTLGSHPDD